jgi:hypothetical protein
MSDTLFGENNYFYHASVRRYVSLFGTLFTDIFIKRKSDDGTKEETIKVPIKYGNGNMYLKVAQDQTRDTKQIARTLPAIAFELENLYKDVSRKTNPMNRIQNVNLDANGTRDWQFNRIPYNFLFALTIRTKNTDDMLQIVEQIVPAFDGNLSVSIMDTTGVIVEQDIIISLEEISIQDNFDDEMQSRLIEYKITFELRGYLYKRTQNSLTLKEVDIQAITDNGFVLSTEIVNSSDISNTQNNLDSMLVTIDRLTTT